MSMVIWTKFCMNQSSTSEEEQEEKKKKKGTGVGSALLVATHRH